MPTFGTSLLLYFSLFSLITKLNLVHALDSKSDLSNAVVGSPIVECEREYIHFSVPTKKPFRGRIYVKGEYANADCVRIYDLTENEGESAEVHRNEVASGDEALSNEPKNRLFNPPTSSKNGFANYEHGNWRDFLRGTGEQPSSNSRRYKNSKEECPLVCPPCEETARHRRQAKLNSAEIDVRLGTCNVQRDRTLNPPGLRVSTVVVISFHQSFVTKVDRAYRVDCLYEESNKQVTTKIDVSMPQTVELSSEMPSPRCEYRIKAQNGVDLKNVRVGDEAVHEWTCAPANSGQSDEMKAMFGMLVHSCFVDDGQGKKQLVVDAHGCSMDNFIMPTPKYALDQLKASVAAPVVKFPDRDVVGFQCAISVFMRELGSTPPKCDGSRNRSRRMTGHKLDDAWQIHAQQLTVLDPETSIDQRQDLDKILNSPSVQSPFESNKVAEYCVSIAAFGFMIASSTFMITITVGVALASLLLRKQKLENLIRTPTHTQTTC